MLAVSQTIINRFLPLKIYNFKKANFLEIWGSNQLVDGMNAVFLKKQIKPFQETIIYRGAFM